MGKIPESNPRVSKQKVKTDIWVDTYGDYLYNYAYHRTENTELSKTLVIETFKEGLAKDIATNESSEQTWLLQHLRNKIQGRSTSKPINGISNDISTNSNAATNLDFKTQKGTTNSNSSQQLMHCIAKLPKMNSKVFYMRTIESHSTNSVCKALKITQNQFWKIMKETRSAILICMTQDSSSNPILN